MKKILTALGVTALCFSMVCSLGAQENFTTLDQVNVNGGTVEMSVSGETKYHAFTVSNPPRIVIELTNAEHNVKDKEVEINDGIIKRVRSGQFQNEPVKAVRVVVDLVKMTEYQIKGNGKTITLVLNGDFARKAPAEQAKPEPPIVKAVSIAPVPAAPLVPAPKPVPVPLPAKLVPQDKAPDAPAKAPAENTDVPAAPAKTEKTAPEKPAPAAQEKPSLQKEAVPAELAAPPAPVKEAIAAAAPAPAVKPKPSKQAKEITPSAPAASSSYTGGPSRVTLPTKPITVDFEEADIRDVLRILSMKSGINIIYGGDVNGTITMRLENVPFDKAFETILSLKGLVGQEQGANILRVATPAKIAEERSQAVTFTKVFPLNYAKGEEVKSNLDSIRSAEGRRGNISVDARTNSLIITDTPEGLSSVERIISDLDRKPAQVIIEARIVEVVLTDDLDLGISWQYADTPVNTPGNVIAIGATKSEVSSQAMGSGAIGGNTVVTPLAPGAGGTGVAFPASAVSGQMSGISFGIIQNQLRLNGMLSALAQKGLSKILSTPKVTTINNKEARIMVGQKIPFTTTTVTPTGSTQSTNFLDVGIKLTVTPTINIDQKITLAVHPEVSLFVRADAAGPVIGTREAQTTVLVNNGETVVIGGLITEDEKKLGTQVPLLGDLPVIGYLFKRDFRTKERTELLVFLTPQIVGN
ncbi:MAG: type IV pilus secretin PilQ [Endomicrobiales bacterium]